MGFFCPLLFGAVLAMSKCIWFYVDALDAQPRTSTVTTLLVPLKATQGLFRVVGEEVRTRPLTPSHPHPPKPLNPETASLPHTHLSPVIPPTSPPVRPMLLDRCFRNVVILLLFFRHVFLVLVCFSCFFRFIYIYIYIYVRFLHY